MEPSLILRSLLQSPEPSNKVVELVEFVKSVKFLFNFYLFFNFFAFWSFWFCFIPGRWATFVLICFSRIFCPKPVGFESTICLAIQIILHSIYWYWVQNLTTEYFSVAILHSLVNVCYQINRLWVKKNSRKTNQNKSSSSARNGLQ